MSGVTHGLTGVVKSIGRTFGFILREDLPDLFFHRGDAPDFDELQRGDAVTFDLGETRDGRDKAKFVKRARV